MNTQKMKQAIKILATKVYGIPDSYVFKPYNFGTEKRGRWNIKIQAKRNNIIYDSTTNDLNNFDHYIALYGAILPTQVDREQVTIVLC